MDKMKECYKCEGYGNEWTLGGISICGLCGGKKEITDEQYDLWIRMCNRTSKVQLIQSYLVGMTNEQLDRVIKIIETVLAG